MKHVAGASGCHVGKVQAVNIHTHDDGLETLWTGGDDDKICRWNMGQPSPFYVRASISNFFLKTDTPEVFL